MYKYISNIPIIRDIPYFETITDFQFLIVCCALILIIGLITLFCNKTANKIAYTIGIILLTLGFIGIIALYFFNGTGMDLPI